MKVVLLLLLMWVQHCRLEQPPCLKTSAATRPPRRYLPFNGSPTDLTIGTSSRITHNVTSHIFSIFLREVLSYDNVKVVDGGGLNPQNAYDLLQKSKKQPIPKVIVNLEVWTDVNFQVPPTADCLDMGLIAKLGRFGWFVRNETDLTWLSFQNPNTSRRFSNDLNDHCKNHFCNDSYTPSYCSFNPCAVLLADRSETDINQLSEHIKTMLLNVRIREVSQLAEGVAAVQADAPLLAVAWHPGAVTAIGQWSAVAFPACDTEQPLGDMSPGCVYESRRLTKLAAKLLTGARPAFEATQRINFEAAHYAHFAKKVIQNPSMSHYDIACEWMNDNLKVLERWKPPGHYDDDKATLRICGIFPLDDVFQARFSAMGLPSAAKLAVERVNNNSNILPHHNLKLAVTNGQCNANRAMDTFIDFVLGYDARELVGILGPACSDSLESLIFLTSHFRTVVISYSAEGSIFSTSDRDKYPYFFRTIGENLAFQELYLKLLQKMGWKRMGALTEDALKYTEYLTHLQSLLRDSDIVLENLKFLRSHVNATMHTYVKDLQNRHIRIIVADIHDAAARAVMCEAYRLEMTAKQGYVWFLPHWLTADWYDTDLYRNRTSEKVPCSTSEMKQAIQGYFSLAYQNYAPNNTITHENITVQDWLEKYQKKLNHSSELSAFAGYTYDAVWTYALALDKLYRTDPTLLANVHTPNATQKYVELIEESDFIGVTGRINFNKSPSRISPIQVLQWVGVKSRVVGTFSIEKKELLLNTSAIRWFTVDGKAPSDGGDASPCALQRMADALNMTCTGAIVTANVIGFIITAIVVAAAVVFYKRKYEKRIGQLEETEKYMKQLGLDLVPLNTSEWDGWEISRDAVVINRKLGEGAFGTVYGGEARVKDTGQPESEWVAAAVKTLKVSATTEMKLDFLGEAELMKRFDHKNIVKLLGVCTRNEPVYTIMEFMLYGDLRSFLQNRRHLVNGRHLSDESNEVSNKRLTAIALDIARGLSYLASQKYVHRDLACRNCLLNSAKVAKIGDFGLTRRMYDSDCYKFSRKGMMPIRWMAPESLLDGEFSSKSDVWAFGVVLFEIITFGSYPFPGYSNNEVLEYVRAGQTLDIPQGAKTQLGFLMKSCWSRQKEKRPDPSELVVFFASNPRVLSPCLEGIPASACLEPMLLEQHMSAPASPLDPTSGFFSEENEPQTMDGHDSAANSPSGNTPPIAFLESSCEREALLPASRKIELRAPLASQSSSEML